MKRLILAFLWTASLSGFGQGVPSPGEMARATPSPPPPPVSTATSAKPAKPTSPAATSPGAVERLAQTNQALLELLKKQQAVLEDIQYDRRLQNRQIQLVEVRLEESLQQNAELQAKIARLEAAAAAAAPVSPSATASNAPTAPPAKAPEVPSPPPAPASYLPAPETAGAPGVATWRRLFTLSGEDSKTSDVFHIQGKHWRVLWHNQDKPGDTYKNTSALFISAFPKGDNIPKKICSKLGSGGDSTDLVGGGDYSLKVEASGGHWELAVEDFR
jgi:hypothetical protein